MISWVVMLVSRLLDYVATVEDEAATAKKPLNGKEREQFLTGTSHLLSKLDSMGIALGAVQIPKIYFLFT